MKKTITTIGLLLGGFCSLSNAALIISQYVETDSGTTPKGLELWNTGPGTIDFSVTSLDILKGTNGGALSSDFTLNTGTLTAGDVMVVGTTDIGTYLDATFGAGAIQFHDEGFTFNGDDSLQIQLGGVVQDTFGNPGNDPGSAWSGGGVSTANSNLVLANGINTGDIDGFTDPSSRFVTVNTNPSGVGGLDGFGVSPVPEPSSTALLGLGGLALMLRRRK